MKRRSEIAAVLSKAIAPFVQELAGELADLLHDHVEAKLAAAKKHAIEKLQAELEGTPADDTDEERDEDRDEARAAVPRRARRRAPRPRDRQLGAGTDRGDRDEAGAGAAKPPACSKCGQAGHNARSCGREPKGSRREAIATRAQAAVVQPPPTKQDRFALIEAAAAARRGASVE